MAIALLEQVDDPVCLRKLLVIERLYFLEVSVEAEEELCRDG